ncbi:hypothetical protein [Lewinella sp. IMCC34191]|nr:hypothetical protein [Lewinella sp. IMCC34191]
MKDCCQPDERPGLLKRVVRTVTKTVLLVLALAAAAAVLLKLI